MPESITTLIARRVDSDHFTLPVFSPVAQEIQQAINADADLDVVESIILKDQALAAEILRLANSAFFAGLARQKTVQQALVRLGIKRVYGMVLMAAQKQSFVAAHPFLDGLMKTLWEQAAASASACRWTALKNGYPELAEDAFLAGLLHDLGSLVVLKATDELLTSSEAPDLTAEVMREVIDALHCDYGHRVMCSWELPTQYALLARDHHAEEADAADVLLQIVRLVDAACAKVGIGMAHTPDLALEALPEVELLGIKDVHLAELEIELEDLREAFAVAAAH